MSTKLLAVLTRPRVGLALLGLVMVTSSAGCGQVVRDIALTPIRITEVIVVETARLPFRVATAGVDAVVQMTHHCNGGICSDPIDATIAHVPQPTQ